MNEYLLLKSPVPHSHLYTEIHSRVPHPFHHPTSGKQTKKYLNILIGYYPFACLYVHNSLPHMYNFQKIFLFSLLRSCTIFFNHLYTILNYPIVIKGIFTEESRKLWLLSPLFFQTQRGSYFHQLLYRNPFDISCITGFRIL